MGRVCESGVRINFLGGKDPTWDAHILAKGIGAVSFGTRDWGPHGLQELCTNPAKDVIGEPRVLLVVNK